MADVRIGSVRVDVRSDSTQFVRGVRSAGNALRRQERIVRRLKREYRAFNRGAQNFVKNQLSLRNAIVTLAGGAGIGLLVKRHVALADQTIKSARATGLSVEAFQELSFAAEIGGVSAENFTSAMTAFAKRVGEARVETGTMTTILRRMDEALFRAIQNADNTEEAFGLIIRAAINMQNEMDRAALLAAAFGRSVGPQLANFLLQGEAGIEAVRQRARELGITFRKDTLASAEQLQDRMTELGKVFETGVTRGVLANADAIEKLVVSMTQSLPSAIENGINLLRRLSDELGRVVILTSTISGAARGFARGGIAGALRSGIVGAVGSAVIVDLVGSQFEEAEAERERLNRELDEVTQRLNEIRPVPFGNTKAAAAARAADLARQESLENRLVFLNEAEARRASALRSVSPPVLTAATPAIATPPPAALAPPRPPAFRPRELAGDRFVRDLLDQNQMVLRTIDEQTAAIGVQGEALARLNAVQQVRTDYANAQLQAEHDLADAIGAQAQLGVELRNRASGGLEQYGRILEANRDVVVSQQQQVDLAQGNVDNLQQQADLVQQIAETSGNNAAHAFRLNEERMRGVEIQQRQVQLANDLSQTFGNFLSRAVAGFDDLGDAARSFGLELANAVTQALLIRPVTAQLQNALPALFGGLFGGGAGGLGANPVVGIPLRQDGGLARGLTLVGERGREVVDFHTPGRVYSNEQLGAALRGGGGDVINITYAPVIESDNEAAVERGLAEAYPIFRDAIRNDIAVDLGRSSTVRAQARR